MFKFLTSWHSQLEPKWLRSIIALLAIGLLLALYALLIFVLAQGFPYALKYLTRYFSEVKIGLWAVSSVFAIAGLTIAWILFRKD
jgi:hypothetical protein